MPRETLAICTTAAFFCIGIIATILLSRSASGPLDEPQINKPVSEIDALFADRTELDKTVWENEVAAQEYEQIIVNYWDRMLHPEDDRYAVLAEFPFKSITIYSPIRVEDLDWGIQQTFFGGVQETLDRAGWLALLEKFEDRGYILDSIEFHQSEFHRSSEGVASSVFDVLLNANNKEGKHRYSIRSSLHVVWSDEQDSDGHYIPGDLTLSDTSMLERNGPQVFEHKVLKPDLHQTNLLVHDLDRDGLSDILLPLNNLLMRNQGNAQFEEEALFSAPGFNPPEPLSAFVVADFDGDGWVDIMCAGYYDSRYGDGAEDSDVGLYLFRGDPSGRFPTPGVRVGPVSLQIVHPKVLTAGDVDGDGDLDLWLAQYKNPYLDGQMPTPFYDANDGYPSYLLLNRGDATFVDATHASGLDTKRQRRTYAASLVDLDGDRDLDLLVSSDFAGTDIYFNDGLGKFTDVSGTALDEASSFAMGHTLGDFDRDGNIDFYVPGMASTTMRRLNQMGLFRDDHPDDLEMRTRMGYGNRMYLSSGSQTFRQPDFKDSVARSGWSWGTTSFDFDLDGDLDIYVANGHLSGKTSKDYCTRFWCHDIYTGDSKANLAVEQLFANTFQRDINNGMSWDGFQKNHLFMNQSDSGFINVAYIMSAAFVLDSRSVVSDDFNNDGRPDLLVTSRHKEDGSGRLYSSLHLFVNQWPDPGNWIGVRLQIRPGGPSSLGAVIKVRTASGEQVAPVVSGDSYRAQHAPLKLFGLGKEEDVDSIQVLWPDGRLSTLTKPKANTYHTVTPLPAR